MAADIPALSPGCISPAPQLKREWSLLANFGRANRSYHEISNTGLAHGFLSSSPTCPATQWSLCSLRPTLKRELRPRVCQTAPTWPEPNQGITKFIDLVIQPIQEHKCRIKRKPLFLWWLHDMRSSLRASRRLGVK
jgi:hypothetical protein